jgi:hypothetical protein
MVPQVSLAPQFLSARLIEPVGQFKDLVHEEGEHVQEKEVVGEMALAMPVVMLDMIAMVLDDIEDLVFDLPSHPAYPCEFFYILFLYRHICYPATVMSTL